MPLTDEQKEQLAALLKEAEAADLGDYVPKTTLKGRLSEKDRAREALQAEYEARLSQLQQEHSEAQKKLREHEDKNKTAEQLFAEKLQEAEDLAAEQRVRAEQLYERARIDALRREVMSLFDANPVKPARAQTAIREAIAELNPKVVDTDGVFSLPAEVPEQFGDWWQKRTDLHAKSGTELTPPGAGTPPGDHKDKPRTLEGLAPGPAQFAEALAMEAASKEQ